MSDSVIKVRFAERETAFRVAFSENEAAFAVKFQDVGRNGRDGVTFTPNVDEEGNLSWSNDGGLENPETVNLMGPQGTTGAAFTYDMFTEEQLAALTGPEGPAGPSGADGMSPVIRASETSSGVTLRITDADGIQIVRLYNGYDGADGAGLYVAGYSSDSDYTYVNVGRTDSSVYTTIQIPNGADGSPGANGADGVSPTVNVENVEGGHRVSITDANGTQTFDVLDGKDGAAGEGGTSADCITVPGGGELVMGEVFGEGPYTLELTADEESAAVTDTWIFTLEDGSTVEKKVVLGA